MPPGAGAFNASPAPGHSISRCRFCGMRRRRRFDETAAIEGEHFARRGLEKELSVGRETNKSALGHSALSALNRHVVSEPKEVSLRERSPGGGEPNGVGFAQMTENAPPKFIGLPRGAPGARAGAQRPLGAPTLRATS